MMRAFPIAIFLFFVTSAIGVSLCSYQRAEERIDRDVHRALQLTLAEMPGDVVTADTLRCFRNHLTLVPLRDTASIALRPKCSTKGMRTEIVAQANCSFLTVMGMSDQRASGALLFIGVLWLLGSVWYQRQTGTYLQTTGLRLGGLVYANHRFATADGVPVRLTPMQHSLLEMFLEAEDHILSKQEICSRLWPGKPYADDTLYTLIRRVRPVLENNFRLKIESDRGRSYILKQR
ncbi:MAG: helix-turn-helix domain-containing protein [Bacteroidales bacterium]|nr:helix-turn-helix domain-containing protein [Bacteroidales bacterium]